MPVFTIDAPSGAHQDAKDKMLKEVTDALHEAWPIPDTRGWLREYPAGNVSQDGRIGAEPVRLKVTPDQSDLLKGERR